MLDQSGSWCQTDTEGVRHDRNRETRADRSAAWPGDGVDDVYPALTLIAPSHVPGATPMYAFKVLSNTARCIPPHPGQARGRTGSASVAPARAGVPRVEPELVAGHAGNPCLGFPQRPDRGSRTRTVVRHRIPEALVLSPELLRFSERRSDPSR